MACYIFGAGSFYGLDRRPRTGDFIIAADGGWLACRKTGITPDLLLGDFDSLSTQPDFPNILRVPVEKDDTDTMLAIRYGLEQGYETFHLYGGTGGRMDHTLANLQALGFLARHGARGYLYEEHMVFTALCNGSLTLPARAEGIFSLFCLGAEAQGVSIQGGQYPLDHGALSPFFPLGVSNHFQGRPVHIAVEDGCLIVGWEL